MIKYMIFILGFILKVLVAWSIENNYVYDNNIYGLDPHTGTHDMVHTKQFLI